MSVLWATSQPVESRDARQLHELRSLRFARSARRSYLAVIAGELWPASPCTAREPPVWQTRASTAAAGSRALHIHGTAENSRHKLHCIFERPSLAWYAAMRTQVVLVGHDDRVPQLFRAEEERSRAPDAV